MILEFTAEAIYWRGPAPFVYVPVPTDLSQEIKSVSCLVTYGWGCIPVRVRIGNTEFKTSLFPTDGVYLVPVKAAVQKAEGVNVGEVAKVRLELEFRR
ncbi:MAG: DUF1905 domain-containing protein [Armatimonadetes bacterium]|nr:DUF1905 domain-containing protein [Armatimonadota bacterium]